MRSDASGIAAMPPLNENQQGPSGRAEQPTLWALLTYVAVFSVLLLEPLDFSLPDETWSTVRHELEGYQANPALVLVDLAESIGHAVLFFPLGPLLAWRWRLRPRQLFSCKILVPVVFVGAVSELLQVFVSRFPTLSDFAMNLVGFAAGVGALWLHGRSRGLRRILELTTSPLGLCTWLGMVLVLVYLSVVPVGRIHLPVNGLGSWEIHFPLSVGNERTGTRPWLGQIERVVVRNRALSPRKVRDIHASFSNARRAPSGDDPAVVAAYSFAPEDLNADAGGAVVSVQSSVGPLLLVVWIAG